MREILGRLAKVVTGAFLTTSVVSSMGCLGHRTAIQKPVLERAVVSTPSVNPRNVQEISPDAWMSGLQGDADFAKEAIRRSGAKCVEIYTYPGAADFTITHKAVNGCETRIYFDEAPQSYHHVVISQAPSMPRTKTKEMRGVSEDTKKGLIWRLCNYGPETTISLDELAGSRSAKVADAHMGMH